MSAIIKISTIKTWITIIFFAINIQDISAATASTINRNSSQNTTVDNWVGRHHFYKTIKILRSRSEYENGFALNLGGVGYMFANYSADTGSETSDFSVKIKSDSSGEVDLYFYNAIWSSSFPGDAYTEPIGSSPIITDSTTVTMTLTGEGDNDSGSSSVGVEASGNMIMTVASGVVDGSYSISQEYYMKGSLAKTGNGTVTLITIPEIILDQGDEIDLGTHSTDTLVTTSGDKRIFISGSPGQTGVTLALTHTDLEQSGKPSIPLEVELEGSNSTIYDPATGIINYDSNGIGEYNLKVGVENVTVIPENSGKYSGSVTLTVSYN